jgi:hypothetical protein
MTKKKSANSARRDNYEAFLRSVRLVAIGLQDCRCHLDRLNYMRVIRERESGLTRINAEYDLTDRGEHNFDAAGRFSFGIENRKTKKVVLSVDCCFESHFHADFDEGNDFPKRFVENEMRLILWPYFRELTSNLTAKMAIRPVVIPLSTDA